MMLRRFLIVLTLIAAPASGAKNVDIVITGGIVVTMSGPNIDNGGVAIDKGKLVAVGDVSAYRGKETIAAHGNAIVPGFINTHTHAAMVLFRGIADDRDLMDWLTHFIF